ncbi:MAG: hypothetical protein ABFE13_16485 [Phycisphaerales bacterium]
MKQILCLLAMIAVVPAEPAAANENCFFISHWCGPEITRDRFAEAAEAGFSAILWGGSPEALDYCQALDVKGLVGDGRFGTNETDPNFERNLDGIIADYAQHPALWGYLVADEPFKASFRQLAAVNTYLLAKDPDHVPLINLNPNWCPPEVLGCSSYEAYVEEFIATVRPRMLSFDHYPILRDPREIAGDVEQTRRQKLYFENFEIIRRQSLEHHIPFNCIILATPHAHYGELSEADIQWQVNVALAYGARGVMYFTYTTPEGADYEYQPAIIDKKGKRTERFEQVKRINSRIRTLAPTLLRLTSTAVYYAGALPQGTKALPHGGLIGDVAGGDLIIGQFTSDDGSRYAMFVNQSSKKVAQVTISFSQKVALSEVDATSGIENPVATNSAGQASAWSIAFEPGQGRLIRLQTAENLLLRYWEDKP